MAEAVRVRGAHLRAVPNVVSRETVRSLEELLQGARDGAVTGIAFVASVSHQAGGGFVSDVCGQCYENPTMARGMVAYLADEVAGVQHRALAP